MAASCEDCIDSEAHSTLFVCICVSSLGSGFNYVDFKIDFAFVWYSKVYIATMLSDNQLQISKKKYTEKQAPYKLYADTVLWQ